MQAAVPMQKSFLGQQLNGTSAVRSATSKLSTQDLRIFAQVEPQSVAEGQCIGSRTVR